MRHLQGGQGSGRGAAEGKEPRSAHSRALGLFLLLAPVAGSLAVYLRREAEKYVWTVCGGGRVADVKVLKGLSRGT